MKTNFLRSASLTSIVLPAIAFAASLILGFKPANAAAISFCIFSFTLYSNTVPFMESTKLINIARFGIVVGLVCTAIAHHFGSTGMIVLFIMEVIQFTYNWVFGYSALSQLDSKLVSRAECTNA